MGYLPQMIEVDSNVEVVGEFRGYNHNPRIGDGEFYDMCNMSGAAYPLLAPRAKRKKIRTLSGTPNGLMAHERLCWVDGTDLFYDGQIIAQVEDSPKTMVAMGAQIVIWPDKTLYNTQTGAYEQLEQHNAVTGNVTATLCKMDGEVYEISTVGTAPENPTNGQLYIDTGSDPHVLRQYSEVNSMWLSVPTTYVKIEAAGIGIGIKEYDGVSIAGMPEDKLNGDFVVYAADEDYIVVIGILDRVVQGEASVTVDRKIPDMEFVFENDNRLWGCSSEKHEIYACKLGDPKNWNVFLGIASDSYALTIGSRGDFTGACAHAGGMIFLKEDVIHTILGNKPSNYQLDTTNARGVAAGSSRSVAITRETLFYKSAGDVCAYGSAIPQAISPALGSESYHDGVAGVLENLYYLSVLDSKDRPHMLVYDVDKGMWHHEDNTRALFFARLANTLYFIDDQGVMWGIDAEEGEEEKDFEWYAESGDMGLNIPYGKYLGKVILRMEIGDESVVRVEFAYDGEDNWHEAARFAMTRRRSFSVPLIPRRCDTMRIRISGRGQAKIYSLTKQIEAGSEM